MQNKVIIIIVFLLIAGGGFFYISKINKSGSEKSEKSETLEITEKDVLLDDADGDDIQPLISSPAASPVDALKKSASDAATSADTTMAKGAVKEFTVIAKNFKYNQAELRVKKGDTVKITLDSSEGSHDLVIDEFNVRTKQISAGKEETVTFVADQAGSFEYYCSVGSHRQMGMKGTLVVE